MQTDVVIVGAGPVGLTMSLLLAEWGIRSTVIDRRAELPPTPQAHVIRKRSMDVFAKIGCHDDIINALPDNEQKWVTWCCQLAGKEIGRLSLNPTGNAPAWTNLPQNLLTPILLRKAEVNPHITVHFETECVGFSQDDHTVTANCEGRLTDLTAEWLIAADGAGSRLRDMAGITMDGEEMLGQFHMLHFRADLSPWVSRRPGPLNWVLNPDGQGVIIIHEPTSSHVLMTPARDPDESEASLMKKIRSAIGADIDIELLSHRLWAARSQIASAYRSGRVFLAGDAAHRFPPTGGLGLNTGILDAHNLAWKLALVSKGNASASLLDSYQQECRTVAETNAAASQHNQAKLIEVFAAIGRFNTLDELEGLLDAMDEEQRAVLQAAIDAQAPHFLSDGLYPRSVQGFEHVDFELDPDYTAFRLLARDPQTADELVKTSGAIDGSLRIVLASDVGDTEGFLETHDAVLLRPDDQIAWTPASEQNLAAALVAALR